jgi:hypothetical protein
MSSSEEPTKSAAARIGEVAFCGYDFDKINLLLFEACVYPSVRHGIVKLNGTSYEWTLNPVYDKKSVTISYKKGNEWYDESLSDEIPDELLKYIVKEAREKNIRKDDIENPIEISQQRIRERAEAIHRSEDPIEFILDVYHSIHIGDRDVGRGILVSSANQAIVNSNGIQPKLTGETGEGKSHAARTMVHLHPQEYILYETLSDQALYYMQDEIQPGMIIFSDDIRVSEGLEDVIKRSTTNFQTTTTRRVTVKEGGKFTTKKLKIPERIVWLLTSVDDKGSEQLVNRQFGFGVDESPEQDDRIVDFERQKALNGLEEFPVTENVLICREVIKIMKTETGRKRLFKVIIPFADRIAWNDKKNRRNFGLFLDIVRGFAVLRFMQRDVVDECLIATEDDFNDARKLYGSRAGIQSLHITEKEKDFLQTLDQVFSGEADTASMQDELHVTDTRIRQIADRLQVKYARFKVEKRTVYNEDVYGNKTSTTKNFYIIGGGFSLQDYESIVYLDIKPVNSTGEDNELKSYSQEQTPEAIEPRSNLTRTPQDLRVKSQQNEALAPKEEYLDSSSSSDSSSRSSKEVSIEEDSSDPALVCSSEKTSGGLCPTTNGSDYERENQDKAPDEVRLNASSDLSKGLQATSDASLEYPVSQKDFEDYVVGKLRRSSSSYTAFDPAALCSEIVLQYCIDHNLNHDRKTALILGQRFGEFVNGTAADTFLRLTGGKPLNLAEEVK